MNRNRLIALTIVAVTMPIVIGQTPPEGSNCPNDHWDPFCDGGTPVPYGDPYYACSTGSYQDGAYWCCSYMVQNHTCAYPPPSVGKYFDFTGASHTGPCVQEAWGQHCPEEG